MRIVYLLRDHTNSGGIERVISKKANYLVNEGVEVHIVLLNLKSEAPFFYFDPRINFHHLCVPDKSDKALFIESATDYLNKLKADIVISTGIDNLKYAYLLNDGSKKIMEYHFAKYKRKYKLANLDKYFFGKAFNYIYYYKKTHIAKQYDRFVVLTNEDREDWGNLKNICTIHNPLSFMPETCSELTEKRVIAAGRYTGQKGFDYLIAIWAKVHTKFPDWKLSIFGSGRKQQQLEQLIRKFGLENNVELLPPTRNIEEEFKKSAVYAMTSRYEGFGLVLAEAMACGLPVVSYAFKSGAKDIVSDGEDGFLVKMHDEDAFAEKLSLLMADYELRKKMGTAARENILRFAEDRIMPKWLQLFRELAKESSEENVIVSPSLAEPMENIGLIARFYKAVVGMLEPR